MCISSRYRHRVHWIIHFCFVLGGLILTLSLIFEKAECEMGYRSVAEF